ncbi:uncharacterized protein LOC116774299 [Danaus plexippus]|uniref:uncharacterized protein LOC116774299 n=1 Tax=Danaus plexippus TaxID=13037 RepID=UPI002AB2F7A9|nr:uncharacterized protein LOC116774299 [Danaus plexippus]
MAAPLQARLLLWKDYLIRKRKPITLSGVAWATLVMLSLYVVRINVDNTEYPTCQFAARALPSAGLLNFLQSFICNVNNECNELEKFEEIPAYEKSSFSKLQRELSGVIEEPRALNAVGAMSHAARILSSLANVADNSLLLNITRNGLHVNDLFRNPKRVERYLAKRLAVTEDTINSVLMSEIGLNSILKGGAMRCEIDSIKNILRTNESDHLDVFVDKLCSLSKTDVQSLVTDLVFEADLGKYIKMLGDMYFKLSGDQSFLTLGDMATALFRMMTPNSFVPIELSSQDGFSYVNMSMLIKLMDLFEPTFGETDSYKSMRDLVDTAVLGSQYLHKFLASEDTDSIDTAVSSMSFMTGFTKLKKIYDKVFTAIQESNSTDVTDRFFNIASRITNFVFKWLPDNQKHDILFYSTLLIKLVESCQHVVIINTDIESVALNVTLRNPKGVELLLNLPPSLIGNGLEALADAERSQILTSTLTDPGKIFCDVEGITKIFLISENDAKKYKNQLCSDVWQNFINDFVSSFGVYEVKKNINSMASLFVLQTIGKDISDQLYTIDKDFDILKQFIETLKSLEDKATVHVDWAKAWNISEQSELLQVMKSKEHLGKHMLITVHGALAKEVVRQNPLLEYKISPFLKDVVIMVDAMNHQLDVAPKDLQKMAKKMYPDIVQTMLATVKDEKKTYKMLSTPCSDMVCDGLDHALVYLNFPDSVKKEQLVPVMCNITLAIEEGLKNNSIIGQAISKMKTMKHSVLDEINWTQLITGLNKLYSNLKDDYTYLFDRTFGMDDALKKKVLSEMEEVKEYWFSFKNLNRVMHLCVKLGFRVLDLLNHGVFNMSHPVWTELKLRLYSAIGPIEVVDDILQTIGGVSIRAELPPEASSLVTLMSGAPQLITDTVDLIIRDNTDIQQIISILNGATPWPCETITTSLELSPSSVEALKAIERFMCLDENLQEQWRTYLEQKRVFPENWNTTELPKDIFLMFSAGFDTLVNDLDIVNRLLNEAFEESENGTKNLAFAIKYSIDAFNSSNKETIIGNFLTKVDTVLNSINTSSISETVPLNILWKEYLNCSTALKGQIIDDSCKTLGRATWKHTLKFISVAFENVTEDLTTYLKESREQNATLIQKLGFTSKTGIFMIYDRLPDYIAVLINSYFDYGFLSKIRRASQTQFWDCEEVVNALVPFPPSRMGSLPPSPRVLLPLLCPSLLYWVSMPRGDNSLIDLLTKPQHLLFSLEVANLTSDYSKVYANFKELTTILNQTSYKNVTLIKDIQLSTLRKDLETAVDTVLSYKIKNTDPSYLKFSEDNKKQYLSMIYLTKVVTMVNKLTTALGNVNITDDTEEKILESELAIVRKAFKRRPSEVIALHFDLITDVLWKNDNSYKLVDALSNACDRLKNKDTSQDILLDLDRIKTQVCAKQYKVFYKELENVVDEDFTATRNSLLKMVRAMEDDRVTDIFAFFNKRKVLVDSLKTSVRYAYNLGTAVYLKYLQNNLKHYDVILTFLSGGNWWEELRKLYNGPLASEFFDTVEQVFDVSEDILTHLDKIHLVKLLRDVNVNNTEALCRLSLADYVPDGTGALSALHSRACNINRTALFKELPPFMFASQGYDGNLVISSEVDYNTLYSDILHTESMVDLIEEEPKSPLRPPWVTDEILSKFRAVAVNLLSRESLIKISFGVFGNVVDAGTLYLNNSECKLCSTLTTWIKQLNLQLYKRQEYDTLLCALDTMNVDDIHTTLQNNFHWDMAITELISTRNYTKYELNKSVNELLEQIKLQLLDDVTANGTKLYHCLANNVTRNHFGNAALFAKVLSRTAKLLRAMLPHLKEIPGITELQFFKQLYTNVAHKLHANDTLSKYTIDNFSTKIMEEIKNKKIVKEIQNAKVDLVMIKDGNISRDSVFINWDEICNKHDCDNVIIIINSHINNTLVKENLLLKQKTEFWKLNFISTIVKHIETFVEHVAGVVGGVSEIDIQGVKEGKLATLLDTALVIMRDDMLDHLVYSVLGILKELEPILHRTTLQFDITSITSGLKILQRFKNLLIEQDYKINVQPMFPHADLIEWSLSSLGLNNTNFWSVAAPRIQTGQISIKNILNHRGSIADFVCHLENMSSVLLLGGGPVPRDDVLAAVSEQFCGIGDQLAKDVLLVLLENLDYEQILGLVKTEVLSKLYTLSNLTQSEGDAVLSQLGEIATYLPIMRDRMANVGDTLANEPLIARLKGGSVGDVLSSPEFFSDAGNMVCGAPLQVRLARLFRSVVQTPDLKDTPDQKQLDALPTDFCRSLYKDIVSMEGGKILWSFVKPLVMGRILYTPNNPTVNRIIEKANETFGPMMQLVNIVHEMSSSFPFIINMTHHRGGLAVMQNIITQPQFKELRQSLMGNFSAPDINVDSMLDQLGDVEWLGGLLSRSSAALRCVTLQRFIPAAAEHDLALEAARLTMINEFSAGLVFLNVSETEQFPSNISYKIRMDIENAPTTRRIKDFFWVPGPKASFLENMRYFRGFVQIQDMIDKAIIEISMENSGKVQKREIKEQNDWSIYTQQLPYPCYTKDFFQTSLYESQALIVAFYFSFLFSVCSAVRFIVRDKETGNTMLMSVMGVDLRCHTLSWFISSFLELAVTMVCVCVVLCAGGVLPRSDPSLIFVLLMLYAFSVLTFCYMMSKMFSGAGSAAVVSGLSYLLSFMPFVLILSLEAVMTSSLKIFVSLSMSSSLCYAFLFITRLEATGTGAGWSQLWDTPEGSPDMSIGIAALMVIADGVLYLIVGLVLDRFYGIKTTSNITILETRNEKAGVSIVNVSKVYDEGSRRAKRALDGVSMELHQGQITTLLGHNGAGKTTLIKILTGMLKPSKGHVVVRCDSGGGAALGVCPQHDVLLDQLTAREHVQLYAQLKTGKKLEHVRDEVESMLSVLSLGPFQEKMVAQLSGGTRRRLCVALAFVGGPALVSLDEPTAGVDPAARRDIWAMIMKLRENRTILMTTHHLDEAELLSDQIIILHKGQIHTTGSPIEIKRTLGTGYKLSITFPEEKVEGDGIEEKTKDTLAVVKSVVKNANLIDVNGSEVEINLPFYDANGVSNDIQGVCQLVESTLVSGRVSLDCSTLEQVFHDLCRAPDEGPIATPTMDTPSLPESSKSASGSNKSDHTPLVEPEGPLKGSLSQQFRALMYARYLHYIRNKWLVLILIVLPSLFLAAAMAFSSIRPPADVEISLKLDKNLYEPSTQFMIKPSLVSDVDNTFAMRVLDTLQSGRQTRNWTNEDSPPCRCVDSFQQCVLSDEKYDLPEMMLLPDVATLNNWLVDSQKIYIQKRYGGFTSSVRNNRSYLIAWYDNNGHHALPVFLNSLNTAVLRSTSGDPRATITTYTHPLKISTEQLNKDNVYQHIADAGISGMLLIAYSLAGAGGAALVVSERVGRQKRLQLLCGVSPALLAALQLLWDMIVIIINMIITAIILEIFQFPVFVEKNNLPAICILILLYGYACSGVVSVMEKLFQESSLATMLLFCGNAFIGLVGIAMLLILDIISDSDATDSARYILHKILLVSPQFALGDGLLEIAKNTIQAQVLRQFNMDTYRDPIFSSLVWLHFGYLLVVGTAFIITNLLIEYHCFESILDILFGSPEESDEEVVGCKDGGGPANETGVKEEVVRVMRSLTPLTLRTVGNINAGFVDTEELSKPRSPPRSLSRSTDTCSVLRLTRRYGTHVALRELTLGLPPGQCTVLLGENGAGKSTTFSILTGELKPTSGEVYLQGRRVTTRDLCQGLISYCPQSDAVDPLLTVQETLYIFCQIRGIQNIKQVVSRTLDAFELRRYESVRAGSLSGGTRRKLCTALATTARAPLLLLDEPTSGMDPLSRACVWRSVRAWCASGSSSRAALLSTHALDDARRLARRVALLRLGELCAVAPLEECLRRFGGGYVVSCRVREGSSLSSWRRVVARCPLAVLRVSLPTALHFLLPLHSNVDGKESELLLSDIFRLMNELQKSCDIDDYTVNQSSLDQMFLSFTEKKSIVEQEDDNDTTTRGRRHSDELDSVTAL